MQENNIEQPVSAAPNTPECEENAKDNGSYGKFKSADSLYEAYRQLEKEFTRKCQQLNTYQKSMDVDKEVKDMIAVNPALSEYADEIKTSLADGTNCNVKLAECLAGKVNDPCNIIKSEDFLEQYVYHNKDITDKVIESYLEDLQSKRSSATIKGRGLAYVSPSYRPQSLQEAGKMAKNYIENRRI